MDVASPLSFDTNVVVAGETVRLLVTVRRKGEEEEVGGAGTITACSYPQTELHIKRRREEQLPEEEKREKEKEIEHDKEENKTKEENKEMKTECYEVLFTPSEAALYKLEVKCRDQHVPGSPFSLKALPRASFTAGASSTNDSYSMDAAEPLTLVLPGWQQDGVVEVRGPEGGECEAVVSSEGSVSFLPIQPGDYLIHYAAEEGLEGEEYCITVRQNRLGAQYCHVVPEDQPLLQSPIRFREGLEVSFRVATQDAFGLDLLQAEVQGLVQGEVRVVDNNDGTESVTFRPAMPGRCKLDVLWGGHHIQGSPFTLHLKRPKLEVFDNSINLEGEPFLLGIPYRFKLKCEGAKSGDLKLSCTPTTAASVSLQPTADASTFLCQIVPQESGRHKISVLFQGAHIPGSPFPALFRCRGQASKCQVLGSVEQVQTGQAILFSVSTTGAGEGQLSAVGRDRNGGGRLAAVVKQVGKERYMVQFEPGTISSECDLGVMYDKQHIPGSPFRLLFKRGASFSVEGDGLVHASTNQWNSFTIHIEEAGSGALSVFIREPSDKQLNARVFMRGPNVFDVHYFPSLTGLYVIAVRWGRHHIPGSPFPVQCCDQGTASQFTIWKPNIKFTLDSYIEFTVEDGRSANHEGGNEKEEKEGGKEEGKGEEEEEEEEEDENIKVSAKSHRNDTIIKGSILKDSDGNFSCNLLPPHTGRYSVSVTWKGNHLPGSPFKVTVTAPPQPERVRVWGRGLGDHWMSSIGSSFIVDTTEAGTGMLKIKVHGPKGAFNITSQKDPEDPRRVEITYHPTEPGDYSVEVTWAQEQVPGSPFSLNVTQPPEVQVAET